MLLALSAAAGWMSMGCGGGEDAEPTDAASDDATMEAPARWAYEGELGPERWGQIDAEFAACGSGTRQSPIDIPADIAPGEFHSLAFDYAPAPATLVDNGHTMQVNLTAGASELAIDGEIYSLVQFHFHAHSEHAVDGTFKPLELHLVHRSASGALAVVGVFLDVGAENTALSPIFAGMASASLIPSALEADVDPSELLPASRLGWAYSGSLTTPPCTEGVGWHLMSSALQVSEEQLEAFTSRHHTNRRPVSANTGVVTGGSIRRPL
ncbi:MAG TPA: carbonic anhydrase family protein [Polyangiaceae bacterium]|nr:carbonic anhydrase family protein [Polyangiaceae bacterium]